MNTEQLYQERLNRYITALLPDFLTDIFSPLLGYTGPARSPALVN